MGSERINVALLGNCYDSWVLLLFVCLLCFVLRHGLLKSRLVNVNF